MSHPIVVGKLKSDLSSRSPSPYYSYADVEFNETGWADASKYLPKEFDLCLLKRDDSKIFKGWHSFSRWDGLNIKQKDNIKFWKKLEENE